MFYFCPSTFRVSSMNVVLFEDYNYRMQLKPLTLTRPVGMLRLGIHTIQEKWEKRLICSVSFATEDYLAGKFQIKLEGENLFVNSSYLPGKELLKKIHELNAGQYIAQGADIVAYYAERLMPVDELRSGFQAVSLDAAQCTVIRHLPDLFLNNGKEIAEDMEYIKTGRVSKTLDDPNSFIYNAGNVFIEEGVQARSCIINAENGPVYIGRNAILQEGSVIIGPAAICEEAMVAYGARIRHNTTLGPVCRVGGEVGNTIFHAFTNKAHDGFLGNSYIGEWCNLGANTNNSNLKNDYTDVKLYDYLSEGLRSTGELFCGTFMGDYSKAGISTMFNTGTVVGVSCNVFGAGFQNKFIPSFSWGGAAEGYEAYRFDKAVQVINATMGRRNLSLNETDIRILQTILNNRKA